MSLQLVDGSGTGPLVVPFEPFASLVVQEHVAPGSVHVTMYWVPFTVSEQPHCVNTAPSASPPPPPKQLAGATPPSSGWPGGGGGTPCEKQSIVPSGAVMQQRRGSPCGTCQPGGHWSQLGVGVGGWEGQLHGGQGGHVPESGSHEGQAQVQPPPLPPALPLPMHSPLPSAFVSQQVTPSPELPPDPLDPPLGVGIGPGAGYQPTGQG